MKMLLSLGSGALRGVRWRSRVRVVPDQQLRERERERGHQEPGAKRGAPARGQPFLTPISRARRTSPSGRVQVVGPKTPENRGGREGKGLVPQILTWREPSLRTVGQASNLENMYRSLQWQTVPKSITTQGSKE